MATGNAHIIIPNNSGSTLFDGEVWIQSFATGIYTQFESDQVHRGIAWFPIRRSEIFVNFTIAWPLISVHNQKSFATMQNFQDAIRQHQQDSAINLGTPTPMTFTFYNNTENQQGGYPNKVVTNNLALLKTNPSALEPLSYQGWIDTVEKVYPRFESVLLRNYRMNVINTKVTASTLIPNTSTGTTFPTPNSIITSAIGNSWIKANTSSGKGINIDSITGSIN